MRKVAITVIILIFVGGFGMLSYPLVSSVINNIDYRNQASEYEKTVEKMSNKKIEKMFKDAQNYNNSLNNNVIITDPFEYEAYEKVSGKYKEVLNVDGNGLIGYLEIPSIDVNLPIGHGTSEEVLSHGAGHLQNTSMPIGGESTHAIISAHSAYPGKTYFDYLTDVKEGDCFYISVLGRKLKYEVDQIKVVLPTETSEFEIIPNEDHVTLVTCTPYSVNTHRLLVRGTRVPYDSQEKQGTSSIIKTDTDYLFLLGYKIPYWVLTTIIVVFAVLIALAIVFGVRHSRRKKASTDSQLPPNTD